MSETVRVHGSLFGAFLNAGESLKLLLQGNVEHLHSYDENAWYSLDEFNELLMLTARYKNSGKILEQVGIEMMRAWYQQGPGNTMISSSLDFLCFQSSSQGFQSVIEGPRSLMGAFTLQKLDRAGGVAQIHSTTAFPRELERGILLGGLGLVSDLLFFSVDNSRHPDYFEILFVDRANRHTLSWQGEDILEETEWRLRHLVNMTEEKNLFWACINDTLNAAYAEMRKQSTQDTLTGTYNRREFFRLAEIELAKAKRRGYALSLLYLDIDHFKDINDSHGHQAGDRALAAFAALCLDECRHYDLLGRLGGEEFTILLPLTGIDSAFAMAERILAKTRLLVVEVPHATLKFTVSIGVAEYGGAGDVDDLIGRADKQLLIAKQRGRNRVSKPVSSLGTSLSTHFPPVHR